MVTGTQPDTTDGTGAGIAVRLGTTRDDSDVNDHSVLGESFAATPLVLPVRGHLDSIKRLLKGDSCIRRGSRQRSLGKSRYCNTCKGSQYGRPMAISKFRETLLTDKGLHRSLWTISGTRLVCQVTEDCHGDVLIEEFRKMYLDAYDRSQRHCVPPEPETLSFLARLREEPESGEG